MNALGVEYASSSEEEGSSTHAAATPAEVLQQQKSRHPTTNGAIVLDGLPAEPPGKADPQVQARIARFLELQQAPDAKSFQRNLQTKKEVANPYILNKVVEYFAIDELQSNFDRQVFDPHGLPLHEYTDKIAVEQKKRQDARLAMQQQRSQIAFTPAKQAEK
jgi:hypothetical protein